MIKINDFLKKPINKFLIWFLIGLLILLVGISSPKADTLYNNDTITFFNNNGSSVEQLTTSYISQINESSANITTIADSYGGLAVLQLSSPLIQNHIYTLFLNIGAESNGGQTRLSSKNCIGIGNSVSNSANNYVNNCISPKFSDYSNSTGEKSRGIFYTFIANSDNVFLAVPYTSQYTCYNCRNYSFGYTINDGGDTSGLTESQVNNLISSQTTIIQNQINNMSDDISNTINSNFQTCRDSINLFNKNVLTPGWLSTQNVFYNEFTNIYAVSDYIAVEPNTTYTLNLYNSSGLRSAGINEYNSNKTFISSTAESNTVITFTTSQNTTFVRFTIRQDSKDKVQFEKGSSSTTYEEYGQICTNKLDDQTNAINDVNTSLNDDTAPNVPDFEDLDVADDSVISDLVTMPITIAEHILDAFNDTCSNYTIPFFNNTTLTLPCFTISDYVGNEVARVIDLAIILFMIYNIAMLAISAFNDMTSLRDSYDSLYVPQHGPHSYQPRHGKE